jgi:hypothetical protein
MIGDDFSQFLLDVFRVTGLAAQTGQYVGRAFNVAAFDEISGRLWQQEETGT